MFEEIKFWDQNEEIRSLLELERQLRTLAKQDYAKITCLEEIKWNQKAKTQWLKEGDSDTKFFQRIASAWSNTNYIHSLLDENGNEVDQTSLNNHITSYFMKLYKDQGIIRSKLDGLQFPRISTDQRWLVRPFEESEIKNVVWSIEDDKALGPDGFSMAFFKACWDVVKRDIIDTVRSFHEESFLDKGSNVTFISLIPKTNHAKKIYDFRLISLVGSVYKIISKALACRLKSVLGGVISPNQSAFLGGRQTVTGSLLQMNV